MKTARKPRFQTLLLILGSLYLLYCLYTAFSNISTFLTLRDILSEEMRQLYTASFLQSLVSLFASVISIALFLVYIGWFYSHPKGKWLVAASYGLIAGKLFIGMIMAMSYSDQNATFLFTLITRLQPLIFAYAAVSAFQGMQKKLPLAAGPAISALHTLHLTCVGTLASISILLEQGKVGTVVMTLIGVGLSLGYDAALILFGLTHQIPGE